MFEKNNQPEEEGIIVSSRLFRTLIIGFGLIFIGIIILIVSLAQNGSGSVGGVIFIGPIPIVFGAGPDAGWLIVISIVLTAVSIILFLILNKRRKKV